MHVINWYFVYGWKTQSNMTSTNGSFNQGVNIHVTLLIGYLFTLHIKHTA